MDKCLRSKDIYEQFADAATALVMDQYAAAMQESIVATRNGKNTNVPENMDRRCRKAIKRVIAKQQRRLVAKKLFRFTGAAAMITLILFGIAGVLFTTVEAIRTPIINFYVEQNERYMEISGTRLNKNQHSVDELNGGDPLNGLLPKGYELISSEKNSIGGFSVLYLSTTGERIIFTDDPYTATCRVDTEDATAERLTIGSCDAILIEENGYQLVWLDVAEGRMCYIEADSLSREEIINLAENIENNQ